MKTVFVTGASGFIGTALVKELIARGADVTAMVREEKESSRIIREFGAKVVLCDLENLNLLPEKTQGKVFDTFYHLAWNGSAGSDRINSRLQLDNAQYAVDAVHVAAAMGCKRFIGAGSIMESETNTAANAQGNKLGMPYIYGAGKLAAHVMSKAAAANVGIDHIWPMITNAYGPGEVSPRFVNMTLRKMIHKEPLQFTAATQNYDFIYIDDVARAFYLVGENGKAFFQYIVGSGSARPLKEFISEMQKALAPDQSLLFGDVPFTGINLDLECFSTNAILKDTGFSPEVDFVEGTRRTMEWLKEVEK